MAQLVKDVGKVVIYGTKGTAGIVGSPAIPAYSTVKYITSKQWVPGPGITFKYVVTAPSNSSGCWAYDADRNSYWYAFGYPKGRGIVGVPLYLGSENTGTHPIWVYEEKTYPVWTYHAAVPAVPAVAYVPMNPNEISISNVVGWSNNKGRSALPLLKGSVYSFNVSTGITGAFIGVGPKLDSDKGITLFANSILISPAGIEIFELGQSKGLLCSSSNVNLYIFKRSDNSIVYRAEKNGVTNTKLGGSVVEEAYIHVRLYTSLDKITKSEYLTKRIVLGGTK